MTENKKEELEKKLKVFEEREREIFKNVCENNVIASTECDLNCNPTKEATFSLPLMTNDRLCAFIDNRIDIYTTLIELEEVKRDDEERKAESKLDIEIARVKYNYNVAPLQEMKTFFLITQKKLIIALSDIKETR